MKNNIKRINFFLAGFLLLLAACTPDEGELGNLLSKEDLKYSITQDATDPNMVILESLTPDAIPRWVTPAGYSTRVKDTVKIAFAGDYTFTYSVLCSGGYVEADPFQLSVTTNNLSYVDDELWTFLTGGPGNEKTWLLDLDASGVCKYFVGPLYFYGTDDSWATVTDGETIEGDSWSWKPDYSQNTWQMSAGDYGTMTFSLSGTATVTVDNKMFTSNSGTGTFLLDSDAKTLKLTGAGILHNSEHDGVVTKWGDVRVMSLTENTMQLGVLRDNSDEGLCYLVYNYISQEYADENDTSDNE